MDAVHYSIRLYKVLKFKAYFYKKEKIAYENNKILSEILAKPKRKIHLKNYKKRNPILM